MKIIIRVIFGFLFMASAMAVDFPKEVIGSWEINKQGCMTIITKSTYEEGIGLCTLASLQTSNNGFTGQLVCKEEGRPVAGKTPIKWDGKNLVVGDYKYSKCKP